MKKRIALVACVKSKRNSIAAARDLYISPLFRGLRMYAESHADRWYILSAEHGVLRPDQIIAPYERSLDAITPAERITWAEGVRRELAKLLPPGAEVIVLAGVRYRKEVEPFLRHEGFSVSVPLEGLTLGKQLRWLGATAKDDPSVSPTKTGAAKNVGAESL